MDFLNSIFTYFKNKINNLNKKPKFKKEHIKNALNQRRNIVIHFNKNDVCNKSNADFSVIEKYLKLIYLIKKDSNFEEFFEYFRKNTNLFIPLKYYDAKGIGKIK
jgi:hypothetical protein